METKKENEPVCPKCGDEYTYDIGYDIWECSNCQYTWKYKLKKANNMIIKFETKCVIELEHKPGTGNPKHVSTKYNLEVSDNLDKSGYIDDEGLPTPAGIKVVTNTFVQGLIANIHKADAKGYWDSAEHLRFIISELERGFVQVADSDKSTF